MKLHKIYTERGFTILEVMLSVMIIGIMALLAVPRILDTRRHVVYMTHQQIVADMRYARGLAIAKSESYAVRFSPDEGPYNKYEIVRVADDTIPVKSMQIPANKIVCGPAGGFGGALTFYRFGNASDTGAVILLSAEGRQESINVVRATGRVY